MNFDRVTSTYQAQFFLGLKRLHILLEFNKSIIIQHYDLKEGTYNINNHYFLIDNLQIQEKL